VVRLGRSLKLTSQPPLFVGSGVTVRGDRTGTLFGAELSRDFDGSNSLSDIFDIVGDDVRITARLRGPSRGTDSGQPNSTGVFVRPSVDVNGQFAREFFRTIVDHNYISNFTYGGYARLTVLISMTVATLTQLTTHKRLTSRKRK
jgi:hypothetical protein